MWFPLRLKFLVIATLLAVVPLAIAGLNLTQLTRDELKLAANEDLTSVAAQLQTQFDTTYQGQWLSPLMVIRNGIDSPELDVPQKVSLLTLGLQELPDVMSLQLAVAGSNLPIMATDQAFAQKLEALGLDPVQSLMVPPDLIASIEDTGQFGRPHISQMQETGDWMATLALPLNTPIAGRQVTLAARIELSALADLVARHPFAQRGEITVIDQDGRTVLVDTQTDLLDREIVQSALPLMVAGARANALQTYTRADGTPVLGAYAFPDWFPWAVVAELTEDSAFAVVDAITRQILILGALGFAIAGMGALISARRLTQPVRAIGKTVEKVGAGDLSARVDTVPTHDEIGQLAGRVNTMIATLSERQDLRTLVRYGNLTTTQSPKDGMARGGVRKRVSVIYTRIRGYSAFSERVAPEVVIEALNEYFDVQAAIVEAHQGDVDKFIGDAMVAVFEGADKEQRAVACSVEIVGAVQTLLERFPEYNLHMSVGVASGRVVMGALGSHTRMDHAVLGSTVTLAARLRDKADPGRVLIDKATREACNDLDGVRFDTLAAVNLDGYVEPLPTFGALSTRAAAAE
ncbi:adenylate/guanylate cyclase domain-containing protein [uncultured Tateyamaria sp.]|uniref:adenylate/guanylate cyclase domain-containing protein n=1 Tax=uncultured Tateyamaria sp. TaxID=455651 RepID=UPI00260AE32F|nr:adenylate/guanylate cyclase domain-containing protein [uncultured Tateyamaria sp.]